MVKMDLVDGMLCEPKVRIRLQKEPPTERIRWMYFHAVDLEVEDKAGCLERLVDSMHFRMMNV
jgi:hypothetical protein